MDADKGKFLRIGVIGDFDPANTTHLATNQALQHAGRALGLVVETEWIPTPSLESAQVNKLEAILEPYDGLWCSPGSPYQSMEGALAGIRFARERGKPFVGT
jgi:CTP synthase (UTP-ammonia lyase)